MDKPYLCPDCGDQHDEPGEALLGFRARCLDCQIESDLAMEIVSLQPAAVAA